MLFINREQVVSHLVHILSERLKRLAQESLDQDEWIATIIDPDKLEA